MTAATGAVTAVTAAVTGVTFDGHTHARPQGSERGDPWVAKMFDSHEPQPLVTRSHAMAGARIVSWRQPGDWLIKSPIASTAHPRPSPTPWPATDALVFGPGIGAGGLSVAVEDARSGRRPSGPIAPSLGRPRGPGTNRFDRTQRISPVSLVTRTATTAGRKRRTGKASSRAA